MKITLGILIYFLLLPIYGWAEGNQCYDTIEKPKTITFCYDTTDFYPWTMANGEGVSTYLLRSASRILKVKFQAKATAWNDCMKATKSGQVDGAYVLSYKKKREAYGVYPKTKEGKINKVYHTNYSGYSFYFPIHSTIESTDIGILNLTNDTVAAPEGSSVIGTLRNKFKITNINQFATDSKAILQLVVDGKADAAVLSTFRGNFTMGSYFGDKLQVYKKPISNKPYFVIFSHQIAKQYPAFVEAFWSTIPKARKADDYLEASYRFLIELHNDSYSHE